MVVLDQLFYLLYVTTPEGEEEDENVSIYIFY